MRTRSHDEMKILFLTPRVPWSGVAGGHSLVYHKIMGLAKRGHKIGLATLVGAQETYDKNDPLFCALYDFATEPVPRPLAAPVQLFHHFFSEIPSYFYDYRSDTMRRTVGDLVQRGQYDLVVAEFSAMGQYLYQNPYLPAVRKIISCHFSVAKSAESVVRTIGMSAQGMRLRASMDRLLRYETGMYRSVDRVLVLTAHERFQLLDADPSLRIEVVPCGVDADRFQPDPSIQKEKALIFTGQYEVDSNVDAVRWFLAHCWPKLKERHPDLRFYIVGPGIPERLKVNMQSNPSIILTGGVNDVRPFLQKAMICVCPVRQGTGLRFKLFEVMASGLPLVTTTRGAEGIPLQNGDHCLMADQAGIMVDSINLLLTDPGLRESMARQARELVRTRFNWDRSIERLERVMLDTVAHQS